MIVETKKLENKASFIIITARSAVEDKVRGLNLGADDYIAKPFSLLELLSRINAVARRKFNIGTNDINIREFLLQVHYRKYFT